jgi:hypothetical protein
VCGHRLEHRPFRVEILGHRLDDERCVGRGGREVKRVVDPTEDRVGGGVK